MISTADLKRLGFAWSHLGAYWFWRRDLRRKIHAVPAGFGEWCMVMDGIRDRRMDAVDVEREVGL